MIDFEDLPSKDEIRQALDIADDDMKLWIMVIISSGASRSEAKSMTHEMFFQGTWQYHRKDNFRDALEYLSDKNNVVCTCRLLRRKTDKPYYTFLNPECVQKIAEIKLKRQEFDPEDCLLRHDLNHLSHKFKLLNDRLSLGNVGGFSKLRPHMLRKFNASHLRHGAYDTLNMDDIDCLQGRGKNKTRETYFMDNPDNLKIKYVTVMNNISLYRRYTWKIEDGRINLKARRL